MHKPCLLPVALAITTLLSQPAARAAQPATEQTLDQVVITAQRLKEQIDAERAATPGAVTVLDGDAFHERSVTTLADMLRYVPGVWAESFTGTDEVFYSSRGSNLDSTDYDKNGVKFLQDGLPVTAADGNNHNRAIDPLGARYVTVAHGANALAYGASTLGGAVDFASITAQNAPSASASLSGGSFGQVNARATLAGTSGAVDGLATAETQQRDGYRDHSGQDRKGLYANMGWQSSDRIATRFYASYIDYDIDLPGELSPDQVATDRDQARADALSGDYGKQVKAWRVAAKTMLADVAGGSLELGASHENQSLYHPIVDALPFFSLLIDTMHHDSGAMLRFRREVDAHGLLLGLNYGKSTSSGGNYENLGGERGDLWQRRATDASSLELFALDRWQFAPRWTLVYGAQFVAASRAVHDRTPAGATLRNPDGDYSGFNPRLGLIRQLGQGTEWYASASRVYEAPTTFQMEDDEAADDSLLDAMHGVVVETGVRGTAMRGTTRLNWEASAYYTALRDEILSRDDPEAPGTSLVTNVDRTTHAGFETLIGASFAIGAGGHRIEPLLSATFNAFSFDSDADYGNNRLPSAPRYFARGEFMYRNAAGFSAGPTFDLVGARFTDYANTYRVGAYGLLGMRAGLTTKNWELFAEGRNLLDKEYVATVTVLDQAGANSRMIYPGAPRAVYFGARYQF